MPTMNKKIDEHRDAVRILKLINKLRKEKGLISAYAKDFQGPKVRISQMERKVIAIQVWKDLFPSSLTSANFELGEFTVTRVEEEIQRRIDIRRGLLIPFQK